MPLNLSREDRRLVIVATSLFVVCSLLAIFLTPGESDAQFATTYSTAPQGAKAAYLLLRESGYRIDRWEHPPAELADPQNALLIIADPLDVPSQADRDALEKFLSDGGQVLLAGTYAPVFVYEPGPAPLPVSLGWNRFRAEAPSPFALNAPEIDLNVVAGWSKTGSGVGLYGDESRFTVMQYAHGKGRVLWLASSSLLSNAGLRESGNLEFLLTAVGSKSRHVLWDEYFHGHRITAQAAMNHPQLAWLFGQLGFLAVAILLTFSRRSVPQRAQAAESRLSPLEYVRALGDLYEHAGAANVAVDIAYERFRYLAGKRLGLRSSASNSDLARAAADRGPIDRGDLQGLLDRCESARFFEDLSNKEALALVQRLHHYSTLLKLFNLAAEEKR
jgi:hypothetical protein